MSDGLPARPALRPLVQALPVEADAVPGASQPLFALRDPFKLADGNLVLSAGGLALAGLLDGSRTLAEALQEFERRFGVPLPAEQGEALVRALQEALLLEGPHLERFVAEFTAADRRAPACIGSYPGESAALRAFLEAQWRREGGPGAPPAAPASAGPIRAVISPHIDLHRGGHAYAWCWRAVAEACTAELFVIFGTSHAGTRPVLAPSSEAPPPRYALTRKTFDTPLGPVPTDVEAVERLLDAYQGPDDLLAGEFHHRGEHSIEFQAVYLAHLFGGRRPVRILPILCGALDDTDDPAGDERFAAFHQALQAALAPLPPEKVAYVAGIDLAHVGAQFHEPPASAADLARVAAQDRETLRLALDERSAAAVHRDIARDGDPRNICGHAPLVAMLHALGQAPDAARVRGELLHYDQWYDGASSVTFAAAVYRDGRHEDGPAAPEDGR